MFAPGAALLSQPRSSVSGAGRRVPHPPAGGRAGAVARSPARPSPQRTGELRGPALAPGRAAPICCTSGGAGWGRAFVCLFVLPSGFWPLCGFFFFFLTKCRSVREELSGERRWHRELCRRCSLDPALPWVAARAWLGEASPPAVGTPVGWLPVEFFFFFFLIRVLCSKAFGAHGRTRHRK